MSENRSESEGHIESKQSSWGFQALREYWLKLSGGSENLLPLDQYPSQMEVGTDLGNLFNQMRKDSRDGKERYAVCGFKVGKRNLNQRRVYISKIARLGEGHQVSGEAMDEAEEKARREGIVKLLSDFHSHPNGWWKKLHDLQNFFLVPVGGKINGFSIEDIYHLLDGEILFTGLVESEFNMLLFKARDSLHPFTSFFPTEEMYVNYWRKQIGIRSFSIKRVQVWFPLSPKFLGDLLSLNRQMAQYNRLALYMGEPDKPLTRIDNLAYLL